MEREKDPPKDFGIPPTKIYGFSVLENDVNGMLGFPLDLILGFHVENHCIMARYSNS